ncbi:aminotransferase class I/II-fold pyridoxal phosphate-dependent enzyme [Hymenobacter sp. HMF4947]|uniref:Aminotransferase class I/II-fold pyridoxal phosphate-dependent enzyme n=1 Tax=Hymenobacter ginkgonis TaxID=2682976 RepID=A0A7K1TAA1_9BACT|nr:pyridoxal phosphate-dependent aminotransferase [Hymenobacter ginkgonis]MVN75313.1 aminotransferase class I/II-fold pyridoxal phosphate-dependent enzyme [Hymenobacter ginkgonis]
MSLAISQRGQDMPVSPFRKLAPFAEAAKQQGKKVYHLNIGQPDIATPPSLLEAVRQADIPVLAYSHGAGTDSYRRKLAGYYHRAGIEVTTDEILVTTAGSEAILFTLLTCLNPGDELVVPEPFYGTYTAFAIAAGVKIVAITATIEDGFALPPLAAFEQVITPRTRAILLCNPSNPTGHVYTRSELEDLLGLCQRHNLYLLSDEAYREYCYDGARATSALNLPGGEEHVVVMDTISKRYSACGARVGSLVTRNRTVFQAAFRFAQMRISPPGLGMLLGEAAAELPESYFDENRAEYQARRDLTVRRLQAMPGVQCPVPGGAFYVMAHLPVDDAELFGEWLLSSFSYENQTLMLSPASGFYQTPALGRQQVRLAYVLNLHDLEAALTCLEQALLEYPGRTLAPQVLEVAEAHV